MLKRHRNSMIFALLYQTRCYQLLRETRLNLGRIQAHSLSDHKESKRQDTQCSSSAANNVSQTESPFTPLRMTDGFSREFNHTFLYVNINTH